VASQLAIKEIDVLLGMTQPSIARPGHVGIHAFDIEKERAFYEDVLGLQVTDEDPKMGMVFMSSRPEEEHHEFLICGGRNVKDKDALLLQQVSFRCNSLEDVIGYYKRFKEHNVQFDMIVFARQRRRPIFPRSRG
jgi:catechol 2,3-dioxygenase-like lactoylglutathione lyase family enzyme